MSTATNQAECCERLECAPRNQRSRYFARQSVARRVCAHEGRVNRDKDPVKLAGFGEWYSEIGLSRQESRHFGGIRNRNSDGRSDRARHSALLSGIRCPGAPDRATRTGIRTLCPDRGEADQA